MKITDLKLNEDNPRIIREERFKNLLNNIREFPKGMKYNQIIYEPETGRVLDGNHRLKALIELGYKEIPDEWTKPTTDLNEEEKQHLIIVSNVGFAEWEYHKFEDQNKWNIEKLGTWGIEEIQFSEVKPPKEQEIQPFNKTHILLSFPPEKFNQVQKALKEIIKLEGIEYEQSSNQDR